jgi:hypothetical protein
MSAPKVGDKVLTWFSDKPDGKSTILEVRPYDGCYKQWFKYVVRVSAPRTSRGWMEMSQ